MATLTVQNIVKTGLAPSFSAAAGGGDQFPCNRSERAFLYIKNGGGGSINVTIARTADQVLIPNISTVTTVNTVVAVPAGSEKMIGPFTDLDIDDIGRVYLTYSGVTTVTVAALSVPAETF